MLRPRLRPCRRVRRLSRAEARRRDCSPIIAVPWSSRAGLASVSARLTFLRCVKLKLKRSACPGTAEIVRAKFDPFDQDEADNRTLAVSTSEAMPAPTSLFTFQPPKQQESRASRASVGRTATGRFQRAAIVAAPRPRTTLLSLPDEILQHIFNLLHARYQSRGPHIPPTDVLRVCKRLTPIVRPIWMRALAVPNPCDELLAGILADKDAANCVEEVDIVLDQAMYRLQLTVLARLSRIRKLRIVDFASHPGNSANIYEVVANLVRQLPLLTQVDLPSTDCKLAAALKDISLKRDLRLEIPWSDWHLCLSQIRLSALRLKGAPVVGSFALTSLKRLELSSVIVHEERAIGRFITDLRQSVSSLSD